MAVLHDTATGQEAEIIFSSGGRINRLLMRSASGGLRDVLMRTTDADIVRTNANHFRAAVLAPWANRIGKGQYSWFGTQYQLPCNEDNSLRDDALHGFMLNRSFAVGASAADDTHAEVTIVADVPRLSWPGWPWSFRLSIVFSFDARGLTVTTSMTNTEESASLPFFHSMHPYVNVSRTSGVLLRLGPCEMCGEPRDSCEDWRRLDMGPLAPRAGPLLPLGTTSPFTAFDGSAPVGGSAPNATYYDDEFTMTADAAHCGSAGVTLVDPSYPGDAVTVWGDSNFRVFQVFTGSFTWGEQSVAIEPMSGAANAYNTGDGLTVLAAGATHTDEMGIYFRASAR
ncbi:hypothetical protein FNF27_07087 [Cafeteria roenbergensis]|uniref:Aldose 1-epimerase n=2 Tax=Cafeteria roenbergensis TaxID=33653 RepID=A0A5A8DTZ7_CAFRO|nr:hypothetical protein FNF27_07087 [Cafeteria roenbergensis]